MAESLDQLDTDGCIGFHIFSSLLDSCDQQPDVIPAIQHQGYHLLVHDEFSLPNLIQHAFGHMGEADDGVQRKESGRALDGMGSPKDGVDIVGRGSAALFDFQERRLHRCQQFAGFLDEGMACGLEIHRLRRLKAEGHPRCYLD